MDDECVMSQIRTEVGGQGFRSRENARNGSRWCWGAIWRCRIAGNEMQIFRIVPPFIRAQPIAHAFFFPMVGHLRVKVKSDFSLSAFSCQANGCALTKQKVHPGNGLTHDIGLT